MAKLAPSSRKKPVKKSSAKASNPPPRAKKVATAKETPTKQVSSRGLTWQVQKSKGGIGHGGIEHGGISRSGSLKSALGTFAKKKGYTLNDDQAALAKKLSAFFDDPSARCFLLKGSAGTGKTFLIELIAKYLRSEKKLDVNLAAPTGRAALVVERTTGIRCGTIHKLIYDFTSLYEEKNPAATNDRSPVFYFPIRELAADNRKAVFIIDESSMISDQKQESEFHRFGTGRLLRDLVEYARLREPLFNTKIIFVGDPCQLPPVGTSSEKGSPALNAEYLSTDGLFVQQKDIIERPQYTEPYRITCQEHELTAVERQKKGDILKTANYLRNIIQSGNHTWFDMYAENGDIAHVTPEQLHEEVAGQFKKNPYDGIVVTSRNATAFTINGAIREILWGSSPKEIQKGDRLLAFQNIGGLVNGELIIVHKAHELDPYFINYREKKGKKGEGATKTLRFRKIEYTRQDSFDSEGNPLIDRTVILENFLNSADRDIAPDAFRALYDDFRRRFKAANPQININVTPKPEVFVKALRQDPYVNCARVKYGYAMTCHKAQGGQWDHSGLFFETKSGNIDFLRWAYTGITRAKKKLSVVNFVPSSPISPIMPKFRSTRLTGNDEKMEMPMMLDFFESVVQEAINEKGISMAVHSIEGFAHKYIFSRDPESCIIVFSANKGGVVTSCYKEGKGSASLFAEIKAHLLTYDFSVTPPPAKKIAKPVKTAIKSLPAKSPAKTTPAKVKKVAKKKTR